MFSPDIDHIKDTLRSCKSLAEVNGAAVEFKDEVQEFWNAGGVWRTMAIQIKNLAAWKRAEFRR